MDQPLNQWESDWDKLVVDCTMIDEEEVVAVVHAVDAVHDDYSHHVFVEDAVGVDGVDHLIYGHVEDVVVVVVG